MPKKIDQPNYADIAMSHLLSATYISDLSTHEILYMNTILQRMLDTACGTKDTQYIGEKCYKVLAGLDEPCSFCPGNHMSTGESCQRQHHDARLHRQFDITNTIIDVNGQDVILGVARDINKVNDSLHILESQLTIDETLAQCAQTLSETQDMDVAVTALMSTLGKFYDAERIVIFEISADNQSISNSYEWFQQGFLPQIDQTQQLPIDSFIPLLDAIMQNNEIYVNSAQNNDLFNFETYNTLGLSGLVYFIASALKINNKPIGFLAVHNPKVNYTNMSLLHSVSLFVSNHLNKRESLNEFKRLSSIDMFTGLYNRNKYVQTVNQILTSRLNTVGIVCLDINGLKQTNDKYGHEYGDTLIQMTVSIMKNYFSENVFRIGGDEFVILDVTHTRDIFDKKMMQLRSELESQPELSISIASVWCTDVQEIASQIAHANELMFIRKRNYYNDRQLSASKHATALAVSLKAALTNDEFVVFLQPKIRLSDEAVVGAEALVRKKDGNGGLIPPDQFIPAYEADGIICYLDFAVLEKTCQMLNQWDKIGQPLIPISVNFARISILEYKVADKIRDICTKYNVPPNLIVIELTEHISNIALSSLNEIVVSIQNYGFKVSLDDFGREYSNLAILTNIPFNEIKLDKSLIDNIASIPAFGITVDCTSKMCNAFRQTELVVEGIETYEQLDILRHLNCDLTVGQGYYFSKPLPVDNFITYFNNKLPVTHNI